MSSGPEQQHTSQAASTLAPLLDEMSGAESLVELSGTAARLTIELLGARSVVVIDKNGPVAARPAALDPGEIAELWSAPVNSGPQPRVTSGEDFQIVAIPLRSSPTSRIVAAWERASVEQLEGLEMVANVLETRIELLESRAREDDQMRTGSATTEEERRSEEEFRHLIETVPAIVYKAELGESGRWHFVSPQIERILGYTPEEWTGDPDLWFKSIHPDDIEHALAFEDDRLVGLDVHPPAEYRLRGKDGRYVWIYERARLVSVGNAVPIWHGVMQDITALKNAEEAVQQKIDQQIMIARLGELAMKGEHPDRLIAIAVDTLARQDGVTEVCVWEQEAFDHLYLCHSSSDSRVTDRTRYEAELFPGNRLAKGEIVSILDWETDVRVSRFRSTIDREIRSSMIVPIGAVTEQFGVLTVHSDEPSRFREQDGHFLHATANILANAIERNRTDEKLRHRLHHDPLTDLPNRELFTQRLTESIATARLEGHHTSVLLLDIDHFQLINDGIGHHAGDEMLREVGPRLSRGLRSGDTVARFGGDEFGIILASVKDEEDAHEIANRLLDDISEPIFFEGVENSITASIGISIYIPGIDEEKTAEALIQEADAAMYQAKELGRAQAQVFGQPMREKAVRRLEVERDLRRAIEEDQLVVYYQPIVSLRTGRIFAFEALVRWQHPVDGMVGPVDFIPIAEESDLITQIDTWVLSDSVRQLGEWQKLLPEDRRLVLSVNASSRQIRTTGLPLLVQGLLAEHGVPADNLALEITESVLVAGTSTVKNVLSELHEMGVQLALDDFGTGFSSLSYLNEFPLDSIKIDRSFVEHLGDGEPKGSAIADAIIQIGKSLSLVVVAEAVSSEAQLQMVRDLGCHMAQGFLMSRPVSAEVATAMLEDPQAVFIP
ncbi:MAG: EAL domain-containing protein [Actinomycetota bacterium]|nr:EAL domain-containing protein [Actinomycetota bacterium]